VNPVAIDAELQKARQCMQVKQYAQALSFYAHLTEQSQHGALWFEYGSAAAGSGDFDLADQVWQKLLSREANNAQLLWHLAGEYGKMSLFTKAGALFSQAAKLEPGNLEMQLSLASHMARTSSVDEARTALRRCLGLGMRDEWVRFYSAYLDRYDNKFAEAEQQFRDLLASEPRDLQVLSSCHLELARVLDRSERFDEAMAELEEAKRIVSNYIEVEPQRKAFEARREKLVRPAEALPKNILDIWGESFPARIRAAAPPLAFLGGHIRSGTTLLEKIVDAHPSVAAYDEPLAYYTIAPLINISAPNIPEERLNYLRERYLKNLIMDSGPPGKDKMLLDKNPGATLDLPPILRAFPEMRVLIALRDPRDVMVSSYFIRPVHYMHLSLQALSQHYRNVMDVWLAVREWQGLAWMETRYEDIVADLEKEGRRVTDFLGLQWHENQARFYESNQQKPTKNYNEVNKPVYKRAVGRWRAYEKYLAPILPVLEPYCKKFGYD
jgi:tetratricopeptide (TPR) repeat protein